MEEKDNALEQALKKAQQDPEQRMDFYRQLLVSEVFVPGKLEQEQDGQHIHVKQWPQKDGSLATPFFTRLDTLKNQLGNDEDYITMPAAQLLKMSKDSGTLVLITPDSAKEFKPDEIKMIAASLVVKDQLTIVLEEAIKNPEKRNDFYNCFVNSKIYALGNLSMETPPEEKSEDGEFKKVLNQGDKVSFATWTHPSIEGEVIPIFSSVDLLSRAVNGEQVPYMAFTGLDFLRMAQTVQLPVVMNPGQDINHFFTKEEVHMLVESVRPTEITERVIKPDTKILMKSPDDYPYDMVDALCDLLPQFPEVEAAYVAHMREDSESAEPVLVIGYETSSEWQLANMFSQAAEIVKKYAQEGTAIDFALVKRGEGGVSRYFIEQGEPFYRRPIDKAPLPTSKNEHEADHIDEEKSPGFIGRLKRIFGSH